MKIVLTCDQLLEKSRANEVFELLCEMYKDAEVYTLAHKAHSIGGAIEQRKINSSFISHKVENFEGFQKAAYMVPTAADRLFIPCSVDLIINVSSGLSHGIKKCQKTRQITYLFDERVGPKTWKEKFFGSYLRNWSQNKLGQCDELWVATEGLKNKFSNLNKNIKVLEPGFKIDQFSLNPQVEKGPSAACKLDYYAVNAENLTGIGAGQLISIFEKSGDTYYFVGADKHLDSLKRSSSDPRFLGPKEEGDLSPILSGARGVVDIDQLQNGQLNFPKLALWGLASGRPVIVDQGDRNRDFFKGEGISFASDFSELERNIGELDQNSINYRPQKLRGQAMRYHAIKFKNSFKRNVDKITDGES